MTRYDKLGRRIPDFDRSAANQKGVRTKRKSDKDYFKKLAAKGGRASKGGYFKTLAETDPETLKEISRKGIAAQKAKRLEQGKAGV